MENTEETAAPFCPESSGASALACTDRRRHARVSFHSQAWAVLLTDPDTRHNVVTQDISVLGVGFLSARAFPVGGRIALAIHFDARYRRLILCRCCWVRPMEEGLFMVGAEFEAVVNDEDNLGQIPEEWFEWARRGEAHRDANAASCPLLVVPGVFDALPT